MEQDQELVAVTVSVPRGRLSDLYRHVAALNEDGSIAVHSAGGNREPRPWTADDAELARHLYNWVSPNAQRILSVLMDLGDGHPIHGEKLAAIAEIPKGHYGVAGSLSSVGKASVKVGRALPYRASPSMTGGAGTYEMDETVASLFRDARETNGGRPS